MNRCQPASTIASEVGRLAGAVTHGSTVDLTSRAGQDSLGDALKVPVEEVLFRQRMNRSGGLAPPGRSASRPRNQSTSRVRYPRLTTLPQRRIRQSGHVEHEARGDPAFEDFLEALVDVLQSSCLGDDLGQAACVQGEAVGEVVAGTHQ